MDAGETDKCWSGVSGLFFVFLFSRAGRIFAGLQRFMTVLHNNIAVGKYLVSPLAKPQGTGGFAASVSIRSGQGSATHDRILRFVGLFDSAAQAVQYATDHAIGWIHERSGVAMAPAGF
jgi:hypothetical protein